MKYLLPLIFLNAWPASARESQSDLQRRVESLEKTVNTLSEKVQKMESTLMKGGGFMIVTNFTCEIATPFNGSYSATELSENAARNSVMEECRKKVPDASQCSSQFVKCNNR